MGHGDECGDECSDLDEYERDADRFQLTMRYEEQREWGRSSLSLLHSFQLPHA